MPPVLIATPAAFLSDPPRPSSKELTSTNLRPGARSSPTYSTSSTRAEDCRIRTRQVSGYRMNWCLASASMCFSSPRLPIRGFLENSSRWLYFMKQMIRIGTSVARRAVPGAGRACVLGLTIFLLPTLELRAEETRLFLEKIHHHVTLGSTVADNGDINPYAVIVAPASAGKIHQGDVLVDNFNKVSNLQGTGTTIMDYNPTTKKISL